MPLRHGGGSRPACTSGADPAVLPPPPADDDAVRWIYWTSGTTSAPKGVLHTDRSLRTAGHRLGAALRLGPSDIGSMAFPYAHVVRLRGRRTAPGCR